jgi:hypothetical protein
MKLSGTAMLCSAAGEQKTLQNSVFYIAGLELGNYKEEPLQHDKHVASTVTSIATESQEFIWRL